VRKALKERLPGSIRLSEAIKFKAVAVPTIDPYRTSVEATASSVVLTGHAPSEAAKTALGETVKARLPGRRIDNRLEVGNGAPYGWQACMHFALAGLGRLGAGRAALVRNKLEISGETSDEALQKSLPGEIELAAAQTCDTDVQIKLHEVPEPNLTWKAIHTPSQLILEGEAPDTAAKNELVREAGRLFPGPSVIDRTRAAGVAAGRWTEVAHIALQQLARLRAGTAEIKGQQVVVSGVAAERAIASAIHEQLTRHLVKGYSGRDEIEIRTDAEMTADEVRRRAEAEARRKAEDEARRKQEQAALEQAKRRADEADSKQRKAELDRCQERLKAVVKAGIIQFERASAELNEKSFSTLDELSKALKSCPNGVIEIEGHTDIEGERDRNQRLSEKRAQAVLQYLVDAGVGADRLVAVGYGPDKPIAPNDTAENRAKNRRIELTVKGR
jgi:outer membrane protein OmpA-like peptidoglycan-associated protein